MAKPKKLTIKQDLFCKEYMIDLNATQAAIRAGYSKKTAQSIGSENLLKPVIQAKLSELSKSRAEKLDIDATYVLKRLKEIDSLDVLDIVNDDLQSFRPLREWPLEWRKSISGIDMVETLGDFPTIVKKIKWPDKTKNLEMLGRHITVRAWDKEDGQGDEGLPVNVVFNVNPAVDEIKITNAKS